MTGPQAPAAPRVTFYDVPPDGRWPLVAHLAEAAWKRDKRMLIVCADPEEAHGVDEFLWTFQDEAFLPHELVAPGATPRDEAARVLIVAQPEVTLGGSILLQLTPVPLDVAARYPAVIDIVDHRAPERLAESRARFKAWRERGVAPAHKKR